jgi:hypothetical protein
MQAGDAVDPGQRSSVLVVAFGAGSGRHCIPARAPSTQVNEVSNSQVKAIGVPPVSGAVAVGLGVATGVPTVLVLVGTGGVVGTGGTDVLVGMGVGSGVSLSSPQAAMVRTPQSSARSASLCRIVKPSFVPVCRNNRHVP